MSGIDNLIDKMSSVTFFLFENMCNCQDYAVVSYDQEENYSKGLVTNYGEGGLQNGRGGT